MININNLNGLLDSKPLLTRPHTSLPFLSSEWLKTAVKRLTKAESGRIILGVNSVVARLRFKMYIWTGGCWVDLGGGGGGGALERVVYGGSEVGTSVERKKVSCVVGL